MSTDKSIEERVSHLEREIAFVKRQVHKNQDTEEWLDAVSGSMRDYPEFAEVVELGAEFRRSQTDPNAN
jgi:hypothetical protein